MAKRLTKKEKGFVNDVAKGETGVQAALNNYDTNDYHTAGVIASQNLDKLKILDALKERGFDSDNAKRVVAEILENGEDIHRLNAADKIFKVNGDYAPEKHAVAIAELVPTQRLKKIAELLNAS